MSLSDVVASKHAAQEETVIEEEQCSRLRRGCRSHRRCRAAAAPLDFTLPVSR